MTEETGTTRHYILTNRAHSAILAIELIREFWNGNSNGQQSECLDASNLNLERSANNIVRTTCLMGWMKMVLMLENGVSFMQKYVGSLMNDEESRAEELQR